MLIQELVLPPMMVTLLAREDVSKNTHIRVKLRVSADSDSLLTQPCRLKNRIHLIQDPIKMLKTYGLGLYDSVPIALEP